ncbi:MAG TPA: hypothetical protein VET66_01405 [Steroidobacteraceae bacterium]|nr:hypothetical protein [Steroidobacteraceae bacterium]
MRIPLGGVWLVLLAACSLQGPPHSTESRPGNAAPGAPAPAAPGVPGSATPEAPPAPARQFTLGPAASALVAQAHRQSGGGD